MAPTSTSPTSPTRSPRLHPWGFTLALVTPIVACAAGGGDSSMYGSTGGDSASSSGGASNGGSGAGGNSGGNGGNASGGTSSGAGFTTSGGGDAGQHMEKCDGGVCTCINIASIGHEGVWGPCNADSTTAFQQWLNSQSTAVVSSYDQQQPQLTPQFLSQYDVLILQWMVTSGMKGNEGSPWVFSPQEVTNLQNWVNAGGGLIVLSGYNCNLMNCTVEDTVASNQLLSFTDMQLNGDDTLDGNVDPVKSDLTSENGQCWGTSVPLGASEPPAVTFSVGTWNQQSPVGKNVTEIGAFSGRSIKVLNSSKVMVDATDGTLVYAAHEQVGKGQVVVYGDEWLTYTGEWTGEASCTSQYSFDSGTCAGKSAAQVFQIPQFWYNAIKYASGSVMCFTIHMPGIVY